MARLLYVTLASVDGFIEDAEGGFGWAAPDEQVHAFVNDLVRDVGTYVYGRRMYEVMQVWQDPDAFPDPSSIELDFAALWQAADKVVVSTTLAAPATPRTVVVPRFDDAALAQRVAQASQDLAIAGPTLAAHAFRAGLVDEVQLLLAPVAVGAGKAALPRDQRLPLELVDHAAFDGGWVFLRYRVRR